MILGVAIMIGLCSAEYIKANPNIIDTGRYIMLISIAACKTGILLVFQDLYDLKYWEIICKDEDDINTSHGMIDIVWNESVNDPMIENVSVLKEMICERDCVKEYAL